MSAAQRASQVAGHLNFPNGMLVGQTAIITGSGQGIGAEAARLFANEGAKVVVSDIDGRESSAIIPDNLSFQQDRKPDKVSLFQKKLKK